MLALRCGGSGADFVRPAAVASTRNTHTAAAALRRLRRRQRRSRCASGSGGGAADAAAAADAGAAEAAAAGGALCTCRRCKQSFRAAANGPRACRFHPALFSGGEVAKAHGFVRESAAPEHQLQAVMGRRGLIRFWDCCGAEDEDAPGCCSGFHLTFDSELNAARGWLEQ